MHILKLERGVRIVITSSVFSLIAGCAPASTAPTATAQTDRFAKVEITSTDLGGGVYMLKGSGGNLGLSTGDDGAFLIDDQFAPLSEKIKVAIATKSKTPVRFLINTHWHGDHAGGNENFGNAGAIIVAHENVRTRLSTDQFMKAFNREVKAAPRAAWPIVTFESEINFHQNGQIIRVMHVKNAHTDGDAFVYFEQANVLHMGDVFFNGGFPFIDLGSGGTVDGVIAAQERALALADGATKIIPGHGPLASKSDLEKTLAMIKDIRATVAAAIAKGHDLDQTIATTPLNQYRDYGKGFINTEAIIRTVYTDLSKP